MNEELEVLKAVAKGLEEAGLAYMVTGSVASSFYGTPRLTRDLDIVLEIKKEDTDRLSAIFSDDFYIERDAAAEAVRNETSFNIIHNRFVIKVDFIVRKKSRYRELEFKRRRKVEIEGTPIWMVSPEDLVLSKLFWAKESHSETQLGDVRSVLGVTQNIDRKYVEDWVKSLGLEEVYQKVIQ